MRVIVQQVEQLLSLKLEIGYDEKKIILTLIFTKREGDAFILKGDGL